MSIIKRLLEEYQVLGFKPNYHQRLEDYLNTLHQNTMNSEEWKKQFDEKFTLEGEGYTWAQSDEAPDVKVFIQSLLDQQKKEIVGKLLEEWKPRIMNWGDVDDDFVEDIMNPEPIISGELNEGQTIYFGKDTIPSLEEKKRQEKLREEREKH